MPGFVFRAAAGGALRLAVAAMGLGVAMLSPGPAGAIDVRRDMGGSVEERIGMVRALAASGTPVRISGLCVSACTLLLGVPGACVTPEARLGFHGPTSPLPGIPLPRPEFEQVTREMAAHYPPAIAAWFMAEARMTTGRYITISGAEAIRMGARPCR